MSDGEICDQVAAGDLSGLGDLEFSEIEREALVGAAEDYPEVSGFSFDFSFNFSAAPPTQLKFEDNGRFGEALHYSYGKNAGPALSGVRRL